MRFASVSAVALAAFASLSGVASAEPVPEPAETGTATTTYYTTRTLLRVVQTVWTSNSTTASATSVSVMPTGVSNGTVPTTGAHSASRSLTSLTATPSATSNAAVQVAGVELGFVAMAGLAGLLAL